MYIAMAIGAEGDEILQAIVAALAAGCLMMNMQLFGGPTELASPAISLQNLFVESPVPFRVKSPTGFPLT